MSFGGAECSTGRNPLAQLSKVMNKDTSLVRDRVGPQMPGAPMTMDGGLRTGGMEMAAGDQHMMEQMYGAQQPADAAFRFDDMRNELANFRQNMTPPVMGPQVPVQQHWGAEFSAMSAAEQNAIRAQQPGLDFNPAEFAQFQHANKMADTRMATHSPANVGPVAHQHQQQPMYRQQFSGYQRFNQQMGFNPYQQQQQPLHIHRPPAQVQDKGKGKVLDLDDRNWEEEFAALETANQQAEDDAANKAIDGELQNETLFGDFESVWRNLQDDQLANGISEINPEWVSEFDSQKTWSPDLSSTKSMPNMGDYMFEPDNPYLTLEDPFLEGKRLMESGGNLSLAALAFEAAVQKKEDHVEAWTMLGSCQAQNEKETPAIRALETALKLDPQNLNAMMGLAVSYTNEGYDTTAYQTLERWISTKYPEITKAAGPLMNTDRQAVHDRVTDLFIRAAQLSPEGQGMDSDVQVGLGVLFYGAEEYDKAVDCFNAALVHDYDARDKNHLLWNRLGATLANSGRSEEAINAYERALNINPNFVRARYNLGVSCINIGCYEQAAQHLLGALAMHKVAEDKARDDARGLGMDPDRITHNQSTNLFDTLRRVFSQMGRKDLADQVMNGMDVDVFRGEFEF